MNFNVPFMSSFDIMMQIYIKILYIQISYIYNLIEYQKSDFECRNFIIQNSLLLGLHKATNSTCLANASHFGIRSSGSTGRKGGILVVRYLRRMLRST